jgi:hypothetical protein
MIGWWATKSLSIAFGTMYPMYESYKAIKSPQKEDGTHLIRSPTPKLLRGSTPSTPLLTSAPSQIEPNPPPTHTWNPLVCCVSLPGI